MVNSSRVRRSEIVMIFQENNLFPWLNVRSNVAFGLKFMREGAKCVPRCTGGDAGSGRPQEAARRYPHQLSGGNAPTDGDRAGAHHRPAGASARRAIQRARRESPSPDAATSSRSMGRRRHDHGDGHAQHRRGDVRRSPRHRSRRAAGRVCDRRGHARSRPEGPLFARLTSQLQRRIEASSTEAAWESNETRTERPPGARLPYV